MGRRARGLFIFTLLRTTTIIFFYFSSFCKSKIVKILYQRTHGLPLPPSLGGSKGFIILIIIIIILLILLSISFVLCVFVLSFGEDSGVDPFMCPKYHLKSPSAAEKKY